MRAPTNFAEDIVPLTNMKVSPCRVVRQVDKTHRPVVLTNTGRCVAVEWTSGLRNANRSVDVSARYHPVAGNCPSALSYRSSLCCDASQNGVP